MINPKFQIIPVTLALGFLLPCDAWSETVDLSTAYRCDSMFSAEGCADGGGNRVSSSLRQNIGIVVPSKRSSLPSLPRPVIDLKSTLPANSVAVPLTAAQRKQASQKLAELTGTVGQGAQSEVDTQSDLSAVSESSLSATTNSLQVSAPVTTGYSQNKQLKAGGFLYSDGASSQSQSRTQTQNANVARARESQSRLLGQSLVSGEAAVKANQESSGESKSSPTVPVASGGGEYGQFESGSSAQQPTQSLAKKVTGGLARIAGSLGEKFFGGLGGRGGRKEGPKGALETSGSNKQVSLSKGMSLDRNLLKRRLARLNGQGARSLEFGSSQSFLFNSMCKHYAAYARKNRIANDTSPCPQK